MRTSEDDREQARGGIEGAPVGSPTSTRRAVLGLTAGGLAQATSGLLLPAWMTDEASAAEGQVNVQHGANRRRHRRRHRRAHDQALAVLAVSQPKVIPSGQRTPIRFDMVLALQGFLTQDSSLISLLIRSRLYRLELFLTWNGSGAGRCEAGMMIVNTNVIYSAHALLSPPITTASLTQDVTLHQNDIIQVFGQQDSGAPMDVSAGTAVLYSVDS